jgi:hypothetical protein
MNALDPARLAAQEAASALINMPAAVEPVFGGGRNSRIWRVDAAGQAFALKQYPPRGDDPRDRLAIEVGALRLMESGGIGAVPRVVAADPARGFVLLSWITGSPVTEVANPDIDAAGAFLSSIHALRHAAEAAQLPLASEACLCGAEIERQIRARLAQLLAVAAAETACEAFLRRDFAPVLDRLLAGARSQMGPVVLDFAAELPQEWRSLVPSDFGFHNSLRRGDGSLAFIDFEYFGWDDPVKLTADILLHPGWPLPPPQRRRFRQAAIRLYGEDLTFEPRLAAYLPLFGLRWVLILLNEFIPDRWQRRVLAGDTTNWSDAKARQLEHAREFLAALPRKVED